MTVVNTAEDSVNVAGSALQFTGRTYDRMTANLGTGTLSNQFTVEMLVNFNQLPASGQDAQQNLLGLFGESNKHLFSLFKASSQQLEVGIGDYLAPLSPAPIAVSSGVTATTDHWYHLAATYDGTTVKLYLDGTLVGQAALSGLTLAGQTQTLVLGGNPLADSIFDQGVDARALIDEVRVWSTVKTEAEINAAKDQQLAGGETGLEAYYRFDDTDAGSEIENIAARTGRKVLNLDGNGDYIEIAHDAGLNPAAWTIEGWFNTTHSGTANSDIGRIVSKLSDTGWNNYSLHVYDGKVGAATNSGSNTNFAATSTSTVNDGQWHHAAGVFDGSTLKLYVDGVLEATTAFSGTVDYGSQSVNIGRSYDPVNGSIQFFDGSLDEVRIWSTARTQSDIQGTMNTSLTGSESSLLAAYSFDGDTAGTGQNHTSATGNYNGTGHGNATVADSTETPVDARTGSLSNGSVLTLDGTGDYVQVADNAALNVANWTLESWFQTTSHTAAGDANIGRIVQKAQGSGGNQYTIYMSQGKIYLATNGTGTSSVVSTDTYNDGQWHHAAGSYDGTNLILYVDGQQVATSTVTGSATATHNLLIGAGNDTSGPGIGQYFNGNIDEVRVWSDARTQSEIQTHMNDTLKDTPQGLIAYYTFDDDDAGTGKTIQDATGTVNGTGQGNATVTATTDTPVNSQPMVVKSLGKVLRFDGVDDTLQIVDGDAFDTKSYTLETWVKMDAVDSRIILGRTDSGGLAGGAFSQMLRTDANGKFVHYTFTPADGAKTASSEIVAQAGQWYHLSAIYDAASDTMKLFIDGALVATTTGVKDVWSSGDRYQIGTAITGFNKFDGEMGELRVWSTARSDAEIADNYNQGLSGSESGLVGLYTFDEVTGTSVADSAGTATNGTLSGGVAVVDVTVPLYGNAFTIAENETVSGRMTGNDVTSSGTVTYGAVQPSSGNGSVSIDPSSGEWVYKPPANHTGTVTFQVTATNGGVTDTETVTVTIAADNDPKVHGGALQLDGAGDHVDLGTLSGISGAYTIEAWVNLAEYNATSQGWARIADLGQGEADDNILLGLYGATGKIALGNYVGATQTVITTTAQIPLNQWVHVAAVNNGDGTGAIYFNGVAQSVTGNATDLGAAANVARDHSYIGRSNWGGDDDLKGLIDDVRIWNDARTATEIADNYESQLTGGESNLYAYYTFDAVKGGVVDDKASGDHDGVLKGAVTEVSARNALTLDGADDYLAISNDVLNNRATGTIEAWVFLDANTAETIAVKQHDGVNTTSMFSVGDVYDAGNAGKLTFRPLNGKVAASNTTVSTGTWHHVAVAWTATQINFYLDGQLDGTVNGTGFAVPPIAGGVSSIGGFVQSGAANTAAAFDGLLDEVRVWSTTRTQAEIQNTMHEKVDGSSSGLVAQYSFDADNPAASGTVDNGQGTASLDGTLTNGAAVVATTSDHIRADEAPLIGPSGNIMDVADSGARDDMNTTFAAGTFPLAVTMEAWVNFDRANTQDNFMALLTQGDGGITGKDNPRFVLYKDTAGKLHFWLQDDDGSHGAVIGTSSKVIDTDVWYHIAATYDTATDQAILYLNGENVASGTVTDFTIHSGATALFAAGSDNGGIGFDGQMDNVRVWSAARTADQVREGMTQSYDYDTSGLIGQYTFDDVSGTTVKDNTSSQQDGTLAGSATIVDSGSGDPIVVGHLGKALSFDGTNDTVTFSSTIGPTGNAARTIMLWAKTASNDAQTLVSYGTNTSGGALSLGFNSWVGAGHGIDVDIWGAAITFQPVTATGDGQWHHYAVVVPASAADGTVSLRDLEVYQDGVRLSTVSALAGDNDLAINTASGNLSFGQWVDGSDDFSGQMAEASIWSKALSGAEINDYMTQSLSGEETGLAGYWKLDEGTGTTANDSSNGNHDGTITGATWVDTAPTITGTTHEITEDGTASGQMTSADVTGTPSYTLIGNPMHGAVDLDGATGQYTYTPNIDFQGQDSFIIRAAGATSGTDDEQVFVTIGEAPSLTENHALSLDGTGDYVDLGADNVFATGGSDFTVEAWMKASSNSSIQYLFSFGDDSTTGHTANLYMNGSGNLAFAIANQFGPTGGGIGDGGWHHVALTSTNKTIQLYVDGQASGAATLMSALDITTGNAAIGAHFSGAASLNGQMDEVRFWDKARSQAEIQADMDRQLNGDEANLTGYWNFNEGAGNVAADQSAQNNDGVLVGDATYKNLTTVELGNSQTYKGMLMGEDADGDDLSYALAASGNPAAGTFTLDTDANTFTYVSDGTDGEFHATIDVTDDHGQTSTEIVTFLVT